MVRSNDLYELTETCVPIANSYWLPNTKGLMSIHSLVLGSQCPVRVSEKPQAAVIKGSSTLCVSAMINKAGSPCYRGLCLEKLKILAICCDA